MTIRKFKLFTPMDKIVVGVSGGKDSLVLLENIWQIQKKNPKSPQIEAILIDEGIEGYREESLLYAKEFCKERYIPLHIVSFKEGFGETLDNLIPKIKKNKMNACTLCGTVRRRLLNKKARELSADYLAIGHNLDDTAQTLLQNIIRNDFSKIIQHPPYGNPIDSEGLMVPRIKPLIEIPEEEIVRYCFYKGFPIQTHPCPYSEGFSILRKKIQEFLNSLSEHSPETKYNILKFNIKTINEFQNKIGYNISKKKEFKSKFKQKYKRQDLQADKIEKKYYCHECGEYCGPKRKICFFCQLKKEML